MRTSVLVSALLLAGPALAQETLDQVSDYHNSSYNAALPGWTWDQEVLVGVSGPLARFELSLQSWVPNDEVTVEIFDGRGPVATAPLWTGRMRVPSVNNWQHVSVSVLHAGLHFDANDWFVIRVHGDSQGMGFQGNAYWPNDPYPGDMYENGQLMGGTDNMGFRTWVWTGPGLEVLGSCPGPVTVAASNGTAGGAMAMLHGAPGSFTQTNPARPCPGISLNLAAPKFVGFLQLNAAGSGSLNLNLPAGACGRVLQLVDMNTCAPTNPVVLQ